MTFRICGNKLELLPGVVVPICFCLGRMSFVPGCPKSASAIRQTFYQILRAFALIMLLLFEMGVGFFLDAKDIPAGVWAVVGGFGVIYVTSICIADSMQTSCVKIGVVDGNDYMQNE